jgi:CubicO group peptidase (beta-lactamase class C family)
MTESEFGRRHILTAVGGLLIGESIGRASAATLDWRIVPPAEAGFADNLEALLDKAIAEKRIWNLHGVIVIRNGRLALERYLDGEDYLRGTALGVVSFKPDTLHDLRSVSKSIIGLLYGIALAAGQVPPPDRPLADAFPEYADLFADPGRSRWTLHHVLSMTMGIDWDELSVPYTNPANSEIAMDGAPDRYRYVLERSVVMEPGKRWTYCGGATALLGRIIAKGSGKSLDAYAREVLFDPLGMGPTEWHKGRNGELIAASGIRMVPRDLARIGELMRRGGAWNGRAVVPADWIARCTTPVVSIDDTRQYGYHWYMGRTTPEATTAPARSGPWPERYWNAMGNGGELLVIIPGLDLVVVTMFGNYDRHDMSVPPIHLIREVVLPAVL